ncbi:hypothetical protein PSAC2689_190067 [Paraburkholderia sacchari]
MRVFPRRDKPREHMRHSVSIPVLTKIISAFIDCLRSERLYDSGALPLSHVKGVCPELFNE